MNFDLSIKVVARYSVIVGTIIDSVIVLRSHALKLVSRVSFNFADVTHTSTTFRGS